MSRAHLAAVTLTVTFCGIVPKGVTAGGPKAWLKQRVRHMNLEIEGFVQVDRVAEISVNPEPVELPPAHQLNPEK